MVSYVDLVSRSKHLSNDQDRIELYEDMLRFMEEKHSDNEKNLIGGEFGMIHWVYRLLPLAYIRKKEGRTRDRFSI